MRKITEITIDGVRYKHTSTLAGGSSLYRVWKHRNKIPEDEFINVAGGLYISQNTIEEIEETGLPHGNKLTYLEDKIRKVLMDTESQNDLIDDIVDLVLQEGRKVATALKKMDKLKAQAKKVVEKDKVKLKDGWEPSINDPYY
jgi:ferritin-like metal-binding protein YciE